MRIDSGFIKYCKYREMDKRLYQSILLYALCYASTLTNMLEWLSILLFLIGTSNLAIWFIKMTECINDYSDIKTAIK